MEELLKVTIFAIVILLISLIAGRIPFRVDKNPKNLHLLLTFSAGIMLGVPFIMMLPEALEETLEAGYSYDVVGYMVLLGFVILLVIDYLVKRYLNVEDCCCCSDEAKHAVTSLSVFTGLGIHAFFDGLALSAAFVAGDEIGILVLVGLCLHKSVEVFSLSSTLLLSENKKRAWNFLIAFSCVSPLATMITYLFMKSGEIGFAGPALCFSVGIFLFVSTVDLLPEAFHHKEKGNRQIFLLLLGLALVIVASIITHALMGDVDI